MGRWQSLLGRFRTGPEGGFWGAEVGRWKEVCGGMGSRQAAGEGVVVYAWRGVESRGVEGGQESGMAVVEISARVIPIFNIDL